MALKTILCTKKYLTVKNEISSNETPPLSDPQNDFKLSYESIEKAEI